MAILGMLTLVLTVNAQSKKEMRAEMREKINAEKKVFFQEELDFDDQKMEAVWAVCIEREEELKELKKEFKKEKLDDMSAISEVQAEEMIKQRYEAKQQMLDIDKKYYSKFKEVMTAKEIIQMHQAERAFKKELLQTLKQERKEFD